VTLTLAEGAAVAVSDLLELGGDGRNVLTQSTDLSHADWNVSVGTGTMSVALGTGYKAGTNRSAQVTDSDGLFVPFHIVGNAGDYANTTVTVSGWFQPVSGCTNLGLTLRNISGANTETVRHSAPTGTAWEFLSVTTVFGAIADQIYMAFGNDDALNPGAVWNVQDFQVEVGSKATSYVPTTDGSTPLQTLLTSIQAEFVDGITLTAPSEWKLGEYDLESVVEWPCGYVLVDSLDASMFGLSGAGKGSTINNARVTVGVMDKTLPSEAAAAKRRMYRLLRGTLEALMDAQSPSPLTSLNGWVIGGATPQFIFTPSIATGSSMFVDGRLELTMTHTESR